MPVGCKELERYFPLIRCMSEFKPERETGAYWYAYSQGQGLSLSKLLISGQVGLEYQQLHKK